MELAEQVDVAAMVASVGGGFFFGNMLVQRCEDVGVGASAQLGDDADFDQPTGFEHRADVIVAGQ
ncbi:hypothetical protein D3C79_841330 [compost metagenome]